MDGDRDRDSLNDNVSRKRSHSEIVSSYSESSSSEDGDNQLSEGSGPLQGPVEENEQPDQQIRDTTARKSKRARQVGHYSGGNKRKLSTAISLVGNIRLVLIDEPTTGVDAAAKRQVWSAIQEAQRACRGVVLTSHSMEECEALCTRLSIMVAGQFKCIGTPQHLKTRFSQGYTLTVKLKMEEDSKVNEKRLSELKSFVSSHFPNNKIIEEYQGLIKYYLTEVTYSWSKMFGIMEKDKESLFIDDYSISQTTLEQIFLQFTKYQTMEHNSKSKP